MANMLVWEDDNFDCDDKMRHRSKDERSVRWRQRQEKKDHIYHAKWTDWEIEYSDTKECKDHPEEDDG